MILEALKNSYHKDNQYLDLAEKEYQAVKRFREDDYSGAAEELLNYIGAHEKDLNEVDRAWYYELAATIIEPIDKVRASDLQVKARSLCSNVLKPKTPVYSKMTKTKGRQSEVIKTWLQTFSTGTDVVIAVETIVSNFIYSPEIDHNTFEQSVYEIGTLLGFGSQRPEEDEGDGPDNLWRLEDGRNILIEAKSQKTSDKIPREDIEQLLHSLSWHTDKYGNEQIVVPLLMHPGDRSEDNAHPTEGMRIMSAAKLSTFKSTLLMLGRNLSIKPPGSWTEPEINQQLIQLGLKYDQIIERFSQPLR